MNSKHQSITTLAACACIRNDTSLFIHAKQTMPHLVFHLETLAPRPVLPVDHLFPLYWATVHAYTAQQQLGGEQGAK